MTTHSRGENQTAISVSMTRDLLELVDTRAKALGLNRSQYLAQLARQDIAAKGAIILQEVSAPKSNPPAAPRAAGAPETTKYPPIKR
jgi:hypothetical protein